MTIQDSLPEFCFGLWPQCPPDAPVAWGARGITDRGVGFSLLGDRQTWGGNKALIKPMSRLINKGPLERAIEEARRLRDGWSPIKDLTQKAFCEYWHRLLREKPELFEDFPASSGRWDMKPPQHYLCFAEAPKDADPSRLHSVIKRELERSEAHWNRVQEADDNGEEIPPPNPPPRCARNEEEDYDEDEDEDFEPCYQEFVKVGGQWEGCSYEFDAWVCDECGYHHYVEYDEEDEWAEPPRPIYDAYKNIVGQQPARMRVDRAELFTLYDDGFIVIKGNTNASHGYLYVIAYPKHDVIDPASVKPSSEHPGFEGDKTLAAEDDVFWSGEFPVPMPGDRVNITSPDVGPAVVLAHRVIHNYLHLVTIPEGELPDWWHDQNGERLFPPAQMWNVVGSEIGDEVIRARQEESSGQAAVQ